MNEPRKPTKDWPPVGWSGLLHFVGAHKLDWYPCERKTNRFVIWWGNPMPLEKIDLVAPLPGESWPGEPDLVGPDPVALLWRCEAPIAELLHHMGDDSEGSITALLEGLRHALKFLEKDRAYEADVRADWDALHYPVEADPRPVRDGGDCICHETNHGKACPVHGRPGGER